MLMGFFRAGEAVIIPAVAKSAGAGGAFWQSDLTLYNPNSEPVYITIQFLISGPQGNLDNPIYVDLPDPIPAGGSRVIPDVLGTYFSSLGDTFGALIIYGYNIGNVDKPILAFSRTYTPNEDQTSYFGQGMSGLPWYYYGDPNYAHMDLDRLVIFDLTENSTYRTNLGVLNISADMEEVIEITLYDGDGNKVGSTTYTLSPMAHLQINRIVQAFGVTGEGYSAVIRIQSYQDVNPDSDINLPAFMAYATKIDNRGNDPAYLEAAFSVMPDIDCLWPQGR